MNQHRKPNSRMKSDYLKGFGLSASCAAARANAYPVTKVFREAFREKSQGMNLQTNIKPEDKTVMIKSKIPEADTEAIRVARAAERQELLAALERAEIRAAVTRCEARAAAAAPAAETINQGDQK